MSNLQSFTDQCRQNHFTRFALWAGQSADSKKWSREGSKTTPTPWAGASDIRVYDVDDIINAKVALYRMAFKKANLVAEPITGNDMKRAKVVSSLMKWIIHTQMPDIDREIELLANFILEKGIGATGQFWEVKQEKTLTSVSVQQLQAQMPDIDMAALLADETMAPYLADAFERQYGCSGARAKKMVKELAKDGKTTVATVGRRVSRPVIRAFDLSENLFIPPDTTDIERATGIYRLEYYTPETLRSFVDSDGWDSKWVEKAIETCRGKIIALPPSEYMNPINRSFVYQKQDPMENQVGVVFAYQRLSDEDGVPGIYRTIFNPILPPDSTQDGYAKFGLLEYAHGHYPFIIYRREFLSRRLHDTRGIPEPGKSFQDTIKGHRDSRVDAASISIMPPFGFPMGRPLAAYGPGAKVPERRPNEYHFLEHLPVDGLTEESEAILSGKLKDYCGMASKDGDPMYAQMKNQNEVNRFLEGLAEALTQVFCLFQQYGDDRTTFRVLGMKDAANMEFVKGDPGEFYRFYFSFDTQSNDAELMKQKWQALIQGIQTLDRNGNVNFSEAITAYFESIDPSMAERILEPTEVARDRVMREETEDLTKIFAGWNVNVKPTTPPQMGLDAINTWMQSQDIVMKYQADPAFRARVDARLKQLNFAKQQQDNALIGRQGALMPGPTVHGSQAKQ